MCGVVRAFFSLLVERRLADQAGWISGLSESDLRHVTTCHVCDSSRVFVSIRGWHELLQQGLGSARGFKVSSSLSYSPGSPHGDFFSRCLHKLPRTGCSSLSDDRSCEPALG